MVSDALSSESRARLTEVLRILKIPTSTWYRHVPNDAKPRQRGPSPKPIAPEVERAVLAMATDNPWYGYKRIAVMCRRSKDAVTNRAAYLVMLRNGLLQKRPCRRAELYQTAKLFELLPARPNDLWQADVTYVHIPGKGWHYAVTVIDYYSRYLLACHLTTSYCAAEVTHALGLARAEAERIGGPLEKMPFLVTDNGSSFIARRAVAFMTDRFSHVRIRYRTPTQLGLLERFHRTLKEEEIYWRLYDDASHARRCLEEFLERYNHRRPHWALVPEAGGDPVVPFEVYAGGVKIRTPRWQGWAVEAKKKLDRMMREDAA
jgi:transposase InsO family protein